MDHLKKLGGVAMSITALLWGLSPQSWAQPVQFENGHYYEVIPDLGDWDAAATGAAAMTHLGITGHLVTVTSQEENDFIAEQLQAEGIDRIWIGGSDAEEEGTWKWVVGPEAGSVFWIGDGSGSSTPGAYSNWGGNEPNEAAGGEDHVELLAGGTWNDQNTGDLRAYVVEFSIVPEPTTTVLWAMVTGLAAMSSRTRKDQCSPSALIGDVSITHASGLNL